MADIIDPEIQVMSECLKLLIDLDSDSQLRVLNWLQKKLNINAGGIEVERKSAQSSNSKNLAIFLKESNAQKSQNTKFLAVSIFLHLNGKDILNTRDITQALTIAKQTPLGNASENLNQNTAKGFCVKSGKGFYVSPEGFNELGVTEIQGT